jgi:hypothetical protein
VRNLQREEWHQHLAPFLTLLFCRSRANASYGSDDQLKLVMQKSINKSPQLFAVFL